MLADTADGDTIATYGPAEIVWVQPQPEPPLPEMASVGRGGLFMGIDPEFNHYSKYDADGMLMTNATGDTTLTIEINKLQMVDEAGGVDPDWLRLTPSDLVLGVDPEFTPVERLRLTQSSLELRDDGGVKTRRQGGNLQGR
jgi:hypothetical protein